MSFTCCSNPSDPQCCSRDETTTWDSAQGPKVLPCKWKMSFSSKAGAAVAHPKRSPGRGPALTATKWSGSAWAVTEALPTPLHPHRPSRQGQGLLPSPMAALGQNIYTDNKKTFGSCTDLAPPLPHPTSASHSVHPEEGDVN